MNALLILVILFKGIQSIVGEALQCEFGDVLGFTTFGNVYSCSVTALDNSNDNKVLTGYSGVHQPNKNDRDVKQIYIHDTNTKYIPAGLGSFSDLTALIIRESQLVDMRSKDFQEMQNLEYLSLFNNKLTSVPSDAFLTLTKLKEISLSYNKIKYIGSGAFDQLKNLNDVYLDGNICVNKVYNGATAITQLKRDLKVNCVKPDDIIQYEIENKISDESLKNRKEIKALNEMMKQLLIESRDHQMNSQENIKQRSELSLAKDELKNEHDEKIKITNERDQLEKENADLKKTIQQKLPKMEQTIEDFYMEVMDLKIERHNERQNSIALRTKLMEAKEQLAECKNE
ncbi:unnamed protein product [Diamesa tonsa]